MNIKVNNSSSVKKSSKATSSKASDAEKLGFSSILEQSMDNTEVTANSAVTSVDAVGSFVFDESSNNTPRESKQRSYYILDTLEELEKDILSGNDTKAIAKLEEALNTPALDRDNLPQVVLDLMDEIDLRAKIELEKLKAKS